MKNLVNKITVADCLDVLKTMPNECIDLIVTDPPFNMAYNGRGLMDENGMMQRSNKNKPDLVGFGGEKLSGTRMEKRRFDVFEGDDMTPEEHTAWFRVILTELKRVLKDNHSIYLFIDWRNYARIYPLMEELFTVKNCIVWDKTHFGMGAYYRFQHEFIIYAHKGQAELYLPKANVSDVWRCERHTERYVHPTQKPEKLITWPIVYSSRLGDLVLDPFVGSGTVARVCQDLKRNFICIEKDEKYAKKAEERLRQQNLF